jgi:RluA family pseudouridine synthase
VAIAQVCQKNGVSTGELPLLYLDEHLAVVAKPAGITVVFDRHRPGEGHLWRKVWETLGPVFVVHRLDRDTSGVLLFARDRETQRVLSEAFTRGKVEKLYHAVVAPPPTWRATLAAMPLREDGDRHHRTVVDWERGKSAETQLRLLRQLSELALVEARPKTGRRHQIRAHLAALGCPVVGDALYGGKPLAPRPLLHARGLALRHPATGAWLAVEAPYPPDMAFLE